jgi:hypothetical protein
MANNFKNWIDTPVAGTNVLSQANFASDTQRVNGFKAGDPASAIRVNTGLRQANLVAASLMEAIQVAGVDISSLTHLSTISDVQAKITAGLNTIAKNGLNATTLNGLLSGSNGISIAVNSAGDKVEAKLAIPETGPITLTNNNVPRPAIDITLTSGGPPDSGGIVISSHGSLEQSARLGPSQLKLKSDPYELTVSPSGIISWYHGNEVGHGLISGGPNGNVKTINNQSIYGSGNINTTPTLKTINSQSILGSGNIDTTPTLKTINSQSITGSGNINTLKVYHGNEWNPEIASDFGGSVWVGYRTLSSGQDPTGTGTTSVDINAFNFGDGRGSGGYSDVYCKKLYTSSDERLKENIKSYEPKVSVLDLSIKEFNYKDSETKSVGVIAQEVQKLFPDAVNEDKKSGYLSVDDRSLMYMLMAEVKKLRDRVNELEGR